MFVFLRVKHSAPKLFQRISEEIPHKLQYADSHTIALIVNGYSRLSVADPLLLDDIAGLQINYIKNLLFI